MRDLDLCMGWRGKHFCSGCARLVTDETSDKADASDTLIEREDIMSKRCEYFMEKPE